MGATMKTRCLLLAVLLLPVGWAIAAFDPTAPPRAVPDPSANTRQTRLTWIRLHGAHPLAMYDGVIVRLGDAVEGGRVTAIREDHIVITGKRGRHTVFLYDRSVRTQPPSPVRTPR